MIDIQGYEDLYAITKDYEVYSCLTGKILKPDSNNMGYLRVVLYKNGQRERLFLHRLIAIHFISNPDNLPEVNHKNGDKTNYHPDNLEWVSRSKNMIHGFSAGLISSGENRYNSKLTQQQVDYCRKVCIKGHREFGTAALARKFGVTQPVVSRIVNNQVWNHY